MKTLIYGAGNIGQLYAARLQQAGHDVSILARGRRLREISQHGIRLEDFHTGQRTTTLVTSIERLDPSDNYDLILVILPKHCVTEVLPILAENESSGVMFFGNNAAGPEALIKALGLQRVLLGFPGAAAIECADYLRYLILSVREQPTTIGEVDGTRSDRICQIADALRTAGFPVSVCSNMDAWLKTHAVEIVPTANALYTVGEDIEALCRSEKAMKLMVRSIREGYRVLSALRIPLTPSSRRIARWIPEPLLIALMKRKLADKTMAIKVGHAANARREMQALAAEICELSRRANVATPAIDALQRQAENAPDGRRSMPIAPLQAKTES